MLHSKKIISLLLITNLLACAIPQPENKTVTQSVDVNLVMESAKEPEVLSEEIDSEISLPVSKKFQFNVCLKSSAPEVTIDSTDLVILTTDSETKNLNLDKDFCVQWQESISMTAKTESKSIEISRKLEIKEKFKAPLEVQFVVNPFTNESKVVRPDENKQDTRLLEKMQKSAIAESYELGFESLTVKIEKKSEGQFALQVSGAPTVNGEVLRYGRLQGQVTVNKKVLAAQGSVRDGSLQLTLKDNLFSCSSSESVKIEIQLGALTKKHSIKPFQENHDLKTCDVLEGTHSL